TKGADNKTTNLQEIIFALCVIPGCGDCDNTDVIKWLQCDETFLIGHDTSVVHTSNNKIQPEYTMIT
ncbi:hypothetical protein K0M31_006665, partial [Melipona bicolor]